MTTTAQALTKLESAFRALEQAAAAVRASIYAEAGFATTPAAGIVVIQQLVAESYGITVAVLVSRRRYEPLVTARQMAMTLCYDVAGLSFQESASAFGAFDHGTAICARKKIENRCATDRSFKSRYDQLALQVRNILGENAHGKR